jgi:hypothetical protein
MTLPAGCCYPQPLARTYPPVGKTHLDRLNNNQMSYDDEFPPYTIDSGRHSHSEMDAKFCARMHAAIVEGLESAPIGIVTTPGTKNPKYVANQTATYHRSSDER